MKNIFKSLFLILISLAFVGCEEYVDESLYEYNTTLYIKNSGVQVATLYNTSDEMTYNVILIKAGYDPTSTPTLNVSVLSDVDIAIYNEENGTNYQLLSSQCYSIDESSISFTSEQLNILYPVVFKVSEINKLDSDVEYALPIAISSTDRVNDDKSVILITPDVVIPELYVSKTSQSVQVNEDSALNEGSTTFSIEMPISNEWEFECELQTDQTVMDEYNANNGTNLKLFPEANYSYNKTVQFTAGTNSVPVAITIDRTGLPFGKYALPIKLASCSSDAFAVNPDNNFFVINYSYVTKEKDALEKISLSLSNTNSVPGPYTGDQADASEGVQNMFDGDINTFHHSKYDYEQYPYIDFTLPTSFSMFYFSYTTKTDSGKGGNANPTGINVYTSTDGINYTLAEELTSGLPTGCSEEYESDVFAASGRYVRLEVTGNLDSSFPYFFAFAEFALYADIINVDDLEETQLTGSQCTVNAPPTYSDDAFNLDNLFDGDMSTFYQSDYSYSGTPPVVLDIALDSEISVFAFEFWAHNQGVKGFEACPSELNVYVSSDGETWVEVLNTTSGLPITDVDNTLWSSPVMQPVDDMTFSYIRIETLSTPSGLYFFAFDEFKLYTK